jgi:protein SCO1/2
VSGPLPRRLRIATFLTGLLITALATAGYVALAGGWGKELENLFDAPPFALTDQLERPVRADELRGKVVVADFVYTNCTDVCPFLSAQMQGLQERLRREGLLGTRVQLLSFTVDPARDPPAVLRGYPRARQPSCARWRARPGQQPAPRRPSRRRGGAVRSAPPIRAGAGSSPPAAARLLQTEERSPSLPLRRAEA